MFAIFVLDFVWRETMIPQIIPMHAPSKILALLKGVHLQMQTPIAALRAATTLALLISCIHSKQIKIEVIAKDASAVGTEIALPTMQPMTQAQVQLK